VFSMPDLVVVQYIKTKIHQFENYTIKL